MNDILPEVFQSLNGRVNYVSKITENEWHSSCPRCGGELHEDGTPPDRFVMWIVSRRGTPFGMCRRCPYKWSPEKEDVHWTVKERIEFQNKVAELELAYYRRKTEELEKLSQTIQEQALYKRYHDAARKSPQAMDYFAQAGITEPWVDYLELGFMSDYKVRGHNSTYQDSAYTFPIWSGSRVENVKLRVAHPLDSNDRYRNLYKSGCQHLYTPIHEDDKIKNKVLVMEGEKKAIVAEIYREFPEDVQVVGVQSMTPEKRILGLFKNCEVVYLAFDPEAYVKDDKGVAPVLNVAKQIGLKRCRLVIPPKNTKIDDAILLGWKFVNAFNMAIKPEHLRVS